MKWEDFNLMFAWITNLWRVIHLNCDIINSYRLSFIYENNGMNCKQRGIKILFLVLLIYFLFIQKPIYAIIAHGKYTRDLESFFSFTTFQLEEKLISIHSTDWVPLIPNVWDFPHTTPFSNNTNYVLHNSVQLNSGSLCLEVASEPTS